MENETMDFSIPSNQPVSENGHSLAANKSVDVFNALSLYNEELGMRYEQDGYNPFGEGFVLTEDYANDILQNKSQNLDSILPENFLEYGNKEVAKHFGTSIQNSGKLIDALQNEIAVTTDENLRKQIMKCLVFVKNRNELLKLNIAKLKQKDANAIKMYLEMYGMDSELSELMKDTFTEEANMQMVITQMLNAANKRTINLKTKSTKFMREFEQAQMNQQAEQMQQAQNIQEAAKQMQEQAQMQEQENQQPDQQEKDEQEKVDQDLAR